MSSEVKIRDADFMESQTENESLRARVREIEDENQELRTQNLLLNRTVIELRNELFLMRVQMNELSDMSSLLRERVRNLIQQQQQDAQDNEGTAGPLTAPPLMPPPPPPPPPPLPSARIRISPRQVGAGEALMTPLGVSLSSPPRHRIKRDCRQGFYRSLRNPYRRFDIPEPGPSTANSFVAQDRTNYFVGLRIVPQFQTSFVCAPSGSSEYSDSASDSSGSDENPQLISKSRLKMDDPSLRKPPSLQREYDIFKSVRNFHHTKVRSPILQNYNLSLPNTNSRFIFPIPWNGKSRENQTLPSTSGNQNRFHLSERNDTNGVIHSNTPMKNISNCVQYTFPAIHEGLHHNGISSLVSGQPSRPRKFKRNIIYLPSDEAGYSNMRRMTDSGQKFPTERSQNKTRVDSESVSSTDERSWRYSAVEELPSDFEQDGFQADESSNCMTSADNSMEKICVNDSKGGNQEPPVGRSPATDSRLSWFIRRGSVKAFTGHRSEIPHFGRLYPGLKFFGQHLMTIGKDGNLHKPEHTELCLAAHPGSLHHELPQLLHHCSSPPDP